jgi:hypothetical protein
VGYVEFGIETMSYWYGYTERLCAVNIMRDLPRGVHGAKLRMGFTANDDLVNFTASTGDLI